MLKRTKGILLLTLLVLTGLAGRISSDTITNQERRFLLDHLKTTKASLIKSVKGLSEAQLTFKPAPDKWSIKECVQHIALAEGTLRSMADAALKQPENPEKRSEIKMTDQQLLEGVTNRTNKLQAPEALKPEVAQWKTTNEALEDFKEKRNDLIKFAKTSTDDMRNHVSQTMAGYMDAYQILLLLSSHSKRHTLQIEEIKTDPAFPK